MKSYDELYRELVNISNEINPYYDIDKIKSYSVYIWTKENESDKNVFDIEANQIIVYDKTHTVKDKAKPIIKRIQDKLKEIEQCEKSL